MNNLKKIIILIIVLLLSMIFMQRNVFATQFGGDVKIQKVWNTEEKNQENRKIYNNRVRYNKYDEITTNALKVIILISSVIATYLVVNNSVKLKGYYIFIAFLAAIYIVINRYLVETYLIKDVTGLVYVKILLTAVGVLIGIFAQGKIQKVLMSSTPALIVIILGLIGNNMNGVLKTAFTIWIFTQIILLPQYFNKEENGDSEEGIKEL